MYYVLAGLLTKKFIKLIKEASDGTLDLNKTADLLAVCFPCFLNMSTFYLYNCFGFKAINFCKFLMELE